MTASLQLVTDSHDHDRELARRASSGDDAAFEELYRTHSGRVHALCLRMTGSRERAIELTQDVFVHVWERLASFRGESALSSWIYRLTVNLILSNARRDKRRLTHEMSAESQELAAASEGTRTAGLENAREPSERAVRPASVLDAVDLERAIAGLPPGARTVFVLHDVEGYRHDEIAKLTGTAEGTCRAQLHRARKLLMEALSR
jgi:RNA polymerase sigma-70 factor (ECF subfamily)